MIHALIVHTLLLFSFKHDGRGLPTSNAAGLARLGLGIIAERARLYFLGVPACTTFDRSLISALMVFVLIFLFLGPACVAAFALCIFAIDVVLISAFLLTGFNPYVDGPSMTILLCSLYPAAAFGIFYHKYRQQQ